MSRENVKKFIPLLQAFADGKNLQYKTSDGTWVTLTYSPILGAGDPDRYRVEPGPRVIRTMYNNKNQLYATVYTGCGRFESFTDEQLLNEYNSCYPHSAPFTVATFVEKLD